LRKRDSDAAHSGRVAVHECYAPVPTVGVTFNLNDIEVSMKAIHRVRVAVLSAGLGFVAIAPAMANDIFLKIQGVTGPVTNAGFVGDIQLTAYSQGFTDPATVASGTGAGAGKATTTCGAINITKMVDSTSPDFLQYVTSGVGIQAATVYFLGSVNGATPANVPYTIELHHVRVVSITQGDTVSHTSGLGITENISMIAGQFKFTYRSASADGIAGKVETFTWDCATNNIT
jgi:type VI secretion system secreted protein Hcp